MGFKYFTGGALWWTELTFPYNTLIRRCPPANGATRYYAASRISRFHPMHLLPHDMGRYSLPLFCGRPIRQAVILQLWFLSSYSFSFRAYSQRSKTGCLPFLHTWCGLSANLECISEMCCTRLAEINDAKITQKIAICAPSHNFVGLYLRNKVRYV